MNNTYINAYKKFDKPLATFTILKLLKLKVQEENKKLC